MGMTEHLSADEMDDALSYRLGEEAGDHLASCHGCQVAVEWHRLAKLNQLTDLDHDWYCKSLEALAIRVRQRGGGLVYFAGLTGYRSRLVRFGFEPPPVVRIDSKRK